MSKLQGLTLNKNDSDVSARKIYNLIPEFSAENKTLLAGTSLEESGVKKVLAVRGSSCIYF